MAVLHTPYCKERHCNITALKVFIADKLQYLLIHKSKKRLWQFLTALNELPYVRSSFDLPYTHHTYALRTKAMQHENSTIVGLLHDMQWQ